MEKEVEIIVEEIGEDPKKRKEKYLQRARYAIDMR